jgi:hypothetical protein
MKITNKDILINKLVSMLESDWNGKKGYITDNKMFKYCEFYTGSFGQELKKNNRKSA